MVYRIFVEKKKGLDNEAQGLLAEGKNLLGIDTLENVRLFNRYDAENITEELFGYSVNTVFSEPQVDNVSYEVPTGDTVFAVEPLPGQYDQRADSAAQCIKLMNVEADATVKFARVVVLEGDITAEQVEEVKTRTDKWKEKMLECDEFGVDVRKNGSSTVKAFVKNDVMAAMIYANGASSLRIIFKNNNGYVCSTSFPYYYYNAGETKEISPEIVFNGVVTGPLGEMTFVRSYEESGCYFEEYNSSKSEYNDLYNSSIVTPLSA